MTMLKVAAGVGFGLVCFGAGFFACAILIEEAARCSKTLFNRPRGHQVDEEVALSR